MIPSMIKATNAYRTDRPSIFLAGSIEMGAAEDWQTKVLSGKDIILLNPRRDDWDSSWTQRMSDPQFRRQVEWELDAQTSADAIMMYFDPKTKSPISLLELGLFAEREKLVVCCPDGFWRKGNVEIVCHRYGIPMLDDLGSLALKAYEIAEINYRSGHS